MHKNKWGTLLLIIGLLLMSVATSAQTFTGNGAGNNGEIAVEITMEDGRLTDINVVAHKETPGISDPAFTQVAADILAYQTLAVDTVTGATNTSKGLIAAVKTALEAANADIAAFTAAPETKPQQVEQRELTADVIIVGGGGSGLAAAVSATDNGASVIVIEKTGKLGGNTIVSGGIYNCPDPELLAKYEMTQSCSSLVEAALAEAPVSEAHAALQAAVRADYDAYLASGLTTRFDSANWYALQTWNGGDKVANLDLVKNLADKSFADYQWLKGKGMGFLDTLKQGAGSLYPRTHTSTDIIGTGFISTYTRDLATKGDQCQILMNTTGLSLIVKDDKIVGVNARDEDGNTYVLNANNGVILATGGFAGNVEMRQKYNTSGKWPSLDESVLTTNVPGVTGDGIEMALAVGANLVDMDQIQLMYLGNLKDGSTVGMTVRDASSDYVIFVNEQGERFVREDGRRDEVCAALLEQTNAQMYIIESAADYDVDTALTLNGAPYSEAVAAGDMIIADTVEELAQKMNVDAAVLQASIDGYNAAVDAGVDETFGRVLLINKIEKGPFISVARVATVHHTMGGIQIDTQCRVLRADGTPIQGLLACGETTGGIHGSNRVGGNALVDTVVYGKTAGETAAGIR